MAEERKGQERLAEGAAAAAGSSGGRVAEDSPSCAAPPTPERIWPGP